MRLRILDLNTPWVWMTCFYSRQYGKPFLEFSLWSPQTFQRWWLHVWKWEALPDMRPQMAIMPAAEAAAEGA